MFLVALSARGSLHSSSARFTMGTRRSGEFSFGSVLEKKLQISFQIAVVDSSDKFILYLSYLICKEYRFLTRPLKQHQLLLYLLFQTDE